MTHRLLASLLLASSLGLAACGGGGGGSGSGGPTGSPVGGAGILPGSGDAESAGSFGESESGASEAAEPEPTTMLHVSPSGSDSGTGSADDPLQTVEAAVAKAQPGTKIALADGPWPGVVIAGTNGTEGAPIVLGAAEGARPVFQGAIEVRAAHWILDGLDVASTEPKFSVRFTGPESHDNVLRNSVVHGGTGAAGVSIDLGATRVLVEGNEIYDIAKGPEVDAHGVVIQPDAVDVQIIGNEIHDTTGDSVQCIGPGMDSPDGAPARQILIEGNLMYGTRENAVDIKTCYDVTIRGNVAYGFRKSSTANGEAMVVHLNARNVVVEGNDISDSSRGIVTGRGASDVLIRRNVIHGGVDERTGIILGEGSGLQVVHNTVVDHGRGVLALPEAQGAQVVNNIFSAVEESVVGDSVTVTTNLFDGSPSVGDAGLDGAAQLDAQFVPGAASPAIDAATPMDEEETCGAGPDLGAIERC